MMKVKLKRFSRVTDAAKKEINAFVHGEKLVDFNKISPEEAMKVRRMLTSLDHSSTDFAVGRARPEVPDNIEEIFEKLGMPATSKGIRRMIHTATNPEIQQRAIQRAQYLMRRDTRSNDYKLTKSEIDKLVDKNHKQYIKTVDHEVSKKKDQGSSISHYLKNTARKYTGIIPGNRWQFVAQKPIIDSDNKFDSRVYPDGKVQLGTISIKSPGVVAHEGGHEEDNKLGNNPFNIGGAGRLGSELVASAFANKSLHDQGLGKEDIKRENKIISAALSTYLPKYLYQEPEFGSYLQDFDVEKRAQRQEMTKKK